MGKKKGGRNRSSNAAVTDAGAAAPDNKPAATATVAFVLKIPTHCGCDGCGDKLRSGVRDLALHCDGVVSLDTSALATKGELAVVATAAADPEKLRRRLRKHTGKNVHLVFPNKPAAKPAADGGGGGGGKEEDDAVQALLLAALEQQLGLGGARGHHHGEAMPAAFAWNALQQQHGGGGGGGYGQEVAFPWTWMLQQQQQLAAAPPEPEPYLLSYPAGGAYPAVPSWDAYPNGGGWLGY